MPTPSTAVARAATRTSPARRLRIAVLAAVALTVALGITLAAGAPAFAHDELIASSPESGEVLEAAPAEVALTFSGDIIEAGTAVVVVDHHGEEVEVGAPDVAGTEVTAALPADLTGDYQVRWRAVSADGHPIEGTIDFGVGADATGTWTEEAAHEDAPADSDAAGEAEQAEDTAATGADGTIAGFVVGALGILALAAALIVAARRKSAGPGAGGPGTGSGDGPDTVS
jgi:copper resistance protein C